MKKTGAIAALLVGAAIVLGGCQSSTSKIAEAANAVRREAAYTKQLITMAIDTGEVGPLALPLLEEANKAQDKITNAADITAIAVTKTKDTEPQWLTALKTVGMIVGAVAVCFLFVYLGIGKVVRPIMQRFGMMFTPTKSANAKLDAEKIIEHTATTRDHSQITMNRATDKEYDRAFVYHKRALEKKRIDSL